jgi:uncharacterized membrane protein
MLLAGVNDYRRRRSEAADTAASSSEDAGVSALKSLVMSLGVSGGLSAMAAGERVFATGVSQLLARVLSGSERLYRPVGHAAALSVLGMAIYELIRWVDHRAEHMADAVEPAFATAPRSSMVSGAPGSLVSWDFLSREGRRDVSSAAASRTPEPPGFTRRSAPKTASVSSRSSGGHSLRRGSGHVAVGAHNRLPFS